MIYNFYAIKDLKVGYLEPKIEMNDDVAVRSFFHACSNVESIFYTNPGDFQLWKLGSYDTDTGSLEKDLVFLVDAPKVKKKGVK